MHLNHEILYALVAFLAGGLLGTINGFCLFGAWITGWIFPVPDSLASNDLLAREGRARSKVENEPPFAWSDRYDYILDDIGNVSYHIRPPAVGRVPYAGDSEG